jgi:transcriptional regulator with XRE-family HTH domain
MHTSDSSDTHDKAFERLVRQEELILDVTNRLTEALEQAGVTKAELAKRIERSPGFVSHVFGGGRNLTLKTISDIAAALSLRPTLQLPPDRESGFEVESGWQQ